MVPTEPAKSIIAESDTIDEVIENTHPLYVIVGERSDSPCDHATFRRFQLWVVKTCTEGEIDTYREGNVSIDHWDEQANGKYPHLLNPCECGTYLPMEVDPNPMFSSAIGLLAELNQLKRMPAGIPAAYSALIDAMMRQAERSIDTNTAMEIR